MTYKDVQENVQNTKLLTEQINDIVQKCVQLRKLSKESVVELSKWLDIDRRKITAFEKGRFDIYLAGKILNWYGQQFKIGII